VKNYTEENYKMRRKNMKNKVIMMLVGVAMVSSLTKEAKADNTISVLKEYGIPCALSVGLAAALVKTDGAKIGAALCVGISAATFMNKKVVDDEQLKMIVDQSMDEREMKITAETDAKIQKASVAQDSKMEDFRKVVREVLAERILKMEDEVKADVEKKMASGDFMPALEKKISEKIKEEVILEGKARSSELVQTVVDEVLRQVEAKPYAIPSKENQ
jgi:hypothetical protein